jgi:hypothetical protein
LFRFKFCSPHPYAPLSHVVSTTICGHDVESAFTWSKYYEDAPRLREEKDLNMAVAAATGISSGSARTIWKMLFLGERDWFASLDLSPVLGEATVEGTYCHFVEGRDSAAELSIRMFIDPGTMALRKLITDFESFSGEETRRNIRFNENIKSAAFTRPPA